MDSNTSPRILKPRIESSIRSRKSAIKQGVVPLKRDAPLRVNPVPALIDKDQLQSQLDTITSSISRWERAQRAFRNRTTDNNPVFIPATISLTAGGRQRQKHTPSEVLITEGQLALTREQITDLLETTAQEVVFYNATIYNNITPLENKLATRVYRFDTAVNSATDVIGDLYIDSPDGLIPYTAGTKTIKLVEVISPKKVRTSPISSNIRFEQVDGALVCSITVSS